MKPKKYDYEKLYQKWYKVIWPNFVFYFYLVAALAGAVVGFILGLEEDLVVAICYAVASLLVGFLLARISRFFVALTIAQKVTATDALLAIRNGNNATTADADELPEL